MLIANHSLRLQLTPTNLEEREQKAMETRKFIPRQCNQFGGAGRGAKDVNEEVRKGMSFLVCERREDAHP